MSERHWRLFVEDIIESIDKIETYVANMQFENFTQDSKTIDAVVRNLEIIGEASNHIPDELKKKYSGIEWRKIVGLRNRVIHEYFGVSLRIVWQIIKNEIPPLSEQIKNILIEDDKSKQTIKENGTTDNLP